MPLNFTEMYAIGLSIRDVPARRPGLRTNGAISLSEMSIYLPNDKK